MPCSDHTESMVLEWHDDRGALRYRLAKRSCGAIVGQESLLAALVYQQTLETIANLQVEDLDAVYGERSELSAMTYEKHRRALRLAASGILGEIPLGAQENATLISITYENHSYRAEIDLRMQWEAKHVPSCGNCSNCGSNGRKDRPKRRFSLAQV